MELKEGYKQTEVGVIPEDWSVVPLGIVGNIIRGASPRPKSDRRFYGGNVPRLMVEDVTRDGKFVTPQIDFLTEEGAKRSRPCERGTLTIVCSGTVGVTSFLAVDACIHDGFLALVRIGPSFNDDYLFHQLCALQETFDSSATHGGVFTNLTTSGVKEFVIALPATKAEQEAIAEALSDADALIESLEQLIAKKRQIKQGAMQELLTGKKRLPGFSGEWEERLLPEVSRFRGGKAHEQHIAEHGRFVCVNSKFISSDGTVRKYSTANFCCAKMNDVLIVMSDLPNGKALAKTFLADRDDLYAVNQRVCALTALDNYCGKFLSFVLNRNPYFLKFDDGVNQTHLLNRVFEKCPLLLPPTKDEQAAIATFLSDMDAEIAALESKLSKARQVKQGMMQELLTGKIRLIQTERSHA